MDSARRKRLKIADIVDPIEDETVHGQETIPGHTMNYHNVRVSHNSKWYSGPIYQTIQSAKNTFTQTLNSLRRVESAAFDAYGQGHSGCHPHTRVGILQTIQEWSTQPDAKTLFCLQGAAGSGKSTISWTVAKRLSDRDWGDNVRLGASFFFRRGEKDRSSAALLFPTIARQLAQNIVALQEPLYRAVQSDADLTSKALGEQFAKLVRDPICAVSRLEELPNYVIVLDALDECDTEDVDTVLQLWATLPQFASSKIRVVMTSRPDLPFLRGSVEISLTVRIDVDLQAVPEATIKHDISLFLKSKLGAIRDKHNHGLPTASLIDEAWPDESTIDKLADIAKPLFIVANTICRFVEDPEWHPQERVQVFLNEQKSGYLSQMAQTYLPVLQQIAKHSHSQSDRELIYQQFRIVIGSVVTLAEPLSCNALATLLHTPQLSAKTVAFRLRPMRSVLEIPVDADMPVRPHHLAFGEYITSPESSHEPFHINLASTHDILWRRCLKVLSYSLRENVTGLTYPGQPRSSVSHKQINDNLSAAVQYACRYWVFHMNSSGYSVQDSDSVHTFLHSHFLHWLEVLSLLGCADETLGYIEILQSQVTEGCSTEVSRFLADAHRFTLVNLYIVNLAPLQLYSSALAFAPRKSIVRRSCAQVPDWILRSVIPPMSWDLTFQGLEGHTKRVTSLGFSVDGRTLVSGAIDNTVRFWNVKNGREMLQIRESYCEVHNTDRCNHANILAVAFMLDAGLLVTVSADGTIKTWNTKTRSEARKPFRIPKTVREFAEMMRPPVLTAAVSSDCRHAATLWQGEDIIQIWDIATEQELLTLDLKAPFYATSITFSPDNQYLALGSLAFRSDEQIRIWNLELRKETLRIPGAVNASRAAFSYDGQLVASASTDPSVLLWDLRSGKQLNRLKGHSNVVSALAFSKYCQLLASGSWDKTVLLWDIETGQVILKLEGSSTDFNVLAFSPDDQRLASASDNNVIRLWDVSKLHGAQKLTHHAQQVRSVRLEPMYQQEISSPDTTHERSSWDAKLEREVQIDVRKIRSVYYNVLAISHSGLLAMTSNRTSGVHIFNTKTGQEIKKLECLTDGRIMLCFSPDTQKVAAATSSSRIRIWDVSTGEREQTLRLAPPDDPHNGRYQWEEVVKMKFSSDNKYLTVVTKRDRGYRYDLSVDPSEDEENDPDTSENEEEKLENFLIKGFYTLVKVGSTKSRKQGLSPIEMCAFVGKGFWSDDVDLKVKGNWIECKGEKLLWLPPAYRPKVWAACDDLIALFIDDSIKFLQIRYNGNQHPPVSST